MRSDQLQEVAPLLVPLALQLQQGLVLLRQAFRVSVGPRGQEGYMALRQLVRRAKGRGGRRLYIPRVLSSGRQRESWLFSLRMAARV